MKLSAPLFFFGAFQDTPEALPTTKAQCSGTVLRQITEEPRMTVTVSDALLLSSVSR